MSVILEIANAESAFSPLQNLRNGGRRKRRVITNWRLDDNNDPWPDNENNAERRFSHQQKLKKT